MSQMTFIDISQETILIPCHGEDPELWFAEQTTQIARAQQLCGQCPLIQECLDGAISREEPWGVWGGQVFVGGRIVQNKRGRGRPPKQANQPILLTAGVGQ